MLRSPYLTAVVLLTALCASGRAAAYCRLTTEQPDESSCECVTEGFAFAWSKPTLRYAFNQRGFPGLTDAALRSVFARSFGSWEEVTCDAEAIGFELTAEPGSTPLERRAIGEADEVNVIGHLSAEDWPGDPFAFAVTTVRYDLNSGRIHGADTWFNGGIGNFSICPDDGCPEAGDQVDLLNVATHEAGHFFGLAHSNVRGATMACSADDTDTDKRSLEADDRAGLCAAYPPGVAFANDYVEGKWMALRRAERGACAVSTPGQARGGAAFGAATLTLLALVLRRRRRLEPCPRRADTALRRRAPATGARRARESRSA